MLLLISWCCTPLILAGLLRLPFGTVLHHVRARSRRGLGDDSVNVTSFSFINSTSLEYKWWAVSSKYAILYHIMHRCKTIIIDEVYILVLRTKANYPPKVTGMPMSTSIYFIVLCKITAAKNLYNHHQLSAQKRLEQASIVEYTCTATILDPSTSFGI